MNKSVLIAFWVLCLAWPVSALADSCQNVYCNDFNYICCCSNSEDANDLEVSLIDRNPGEGNDPIYCPENIDVKACVVNLRGELMLALGYDYYIGSGDCTQKGEWATGTRWVCSKETKYHLALGQSVSRNLLPGERIYADSGSNLVIDEAYVERYILRATGKAADCTAGKQVPGSVGCTFNPEGYDRVYGPDGELYTGGSNVLEAGECFEVTDFSLRRQCDNTCDICSKDLDCSGIYPDTKALGNRTLGAVCSNNKLMLYGCEPTGQKSCIEKDVLPDGTVNCVDEVERKSCSLVKQITSGLECCTSDDCRGAGDFYCDWVSDTESRCVLKSECEKDSDCGTAIKCDPSSKRVVEAYCDEKKQCSERPVNEDIECCTTRDCPDDRYCSSSYTCLDIPLAAEAQISGDASETAGSEGYTGTLVMILVVIILILVALLSAIAYMYKTKR